MASEYKHHGLVREGLHTPYIYPPQEKRKGQANKTKRLHSLIYTPLIDSIGHAHRKAEGIAKPVVSEADLPCHQYKKKGKSHEHKHSSSPAAHISEGEIEEDIEHHQLQEIPCHKQGAWDTHLPNNEIDLELCQRLGYMVKAKAYKEEEDSEWVEEEEGLNEPPEPPREPTHPKSRRCRSRCTKGTQTQLGHQPIAREEEEEDQSKRCEEITHT
jgi:hypothetical protein